MFQKVSGLVPKPSKCLLILTSVVCSERNILAIRNRLQINIPGWKDMNITNHGKYLGFLIGPEAGKHNWSSPIFRYGNVRGKFMLLLCLRLFLQVSIIPSVSPPSSMSRSYAPPLPIPWPQVLLFLECLKPILVAAGVFAFVWLKPILFAAGAFVLFV